MKSFWFSLTSVLVYLCVDILTSCMAESYQTILLSDNSNQMFRCNLMSLFYCAEINISDSMIHAMDVFGTDVFAAVALGILWRCKTDAMHTCEILYRVDTPITALALSKDGKQIYIGHSNKIWRCDPYLPNSCFEFHPFDNRVNAVAVSSKFIFAGLEDGNMWRCAMTQTKNCEIFNIIRDSPIQALTVNADYIYAGINNGWMLRCGANAAHTCTLLNVAVDQPITCLDVYEGYVYAGLGNGMVVKCDAQKAHSCAIITTRTTRVNSLKVIPGTTTTGDQCANGQKVPTDWNFMSLKNRTIIEYELNVTRNKH